MRAGAEQRAERFSRAADGSSLVDALTEHGRRLVGGERAAVAPGAAGERWLSTVDGLLAGDVPSVQTIVAVDEGVVALSPIGGEPQSALAVLRPADRPYAAAELALLADVAGLIAIAREQTAGAAPARLRVSEPPARRGAGGEIGDFHHRLPAAFQRLEGLPALNESRDALLRVLGDPKASPDAIVTAIESDVALLIAVLRLANQASEAPSPGIWSVAEAVSVLTPEGVEELAKRMTVFDFFQKIRGWGVPPEHFRLHAVMVQRSTQRLARAVGHDDTDRLVVAALLHDVGKLVLLEAFPGYPEKVHLGAQTPEDRLVAERRQLGVDHEMAGGVLLRRWQLPERLSQLVGRHHTGNDDPDAVLLRLADALAHYAQGRPVVPNNLLGAAKVIGLSPGDLRAIMFELVRDEGPMRLRSTAASPLSERQTEMLRELAKGSSYKQIGAAMGVSVSTVRTHFHNAYRQLGVTDRAQAVLLATERGWL